MLSVKSQNKHNDFTCRGCSAIDIQLNYVFTSSLCAYYYFEGCDCFCVE